MLSPTDVSGLAPYMAAALQMLVGSGHLIQYMWVPSLSLCALSYVGGARVWCYPTQAGCVSHLFVFYKY